MTSERIDEQDRQESLRIRKMELAMELTKVILQHCAEEEPDLKHMTTEVLAIFETVFKRVREL